MKKATTGKTSISVSKALSSRLQAIINEAKNNAAVNALIDGADAKGEIIEAAISILEDEINKMKVKTVEGERVESSATDRVKAFVSAIQAHNKKTKDNYIAINSALIENETRINPRRGEVKEYYDEIIKTINNDVFKKVGLMIEEIPGTDGTPENAAQIKAMVKEIEKNAKELNKEIYKQGYKDEKIGKNRIIQSNLISEILKEYKIKKLYKRLP